MAGDAMTRIDDLAAACVAAGLRVERSAPSATYTTYRCGGPIALLARTGSLDEAAALAAVYTARTADGTVPVLVVGRGSNLLVADRGFDGLAVVLDRDFEQLAVEPASGAVTAGAAVPLPVLARRAAAAGVGGLEFFVGIPGAVGGAVRMNAGGHGRTTAQVLVAARCLDLAGGAVAG